MAAVDTSTIMEEDPSPKNFGGAPKKEELIKRGYDMGFSPKQDNVYVGKHLSTIRLHITPERVAEYVRRTDDRNNYSVLAPATLFPSHTGVTPGWQMPNAHANLHAQHSWRFYVPVLVGDRLLSTRTVVDRYVKRGRVYTVTEASFRREQTRQLMATCTHHQSWMEDQSQAAIDSWHNGTSGQNQGMVVPKERPPIPHPDAEGEVLEKFGPVTHEISRSLCERYQGVSEEAVAKGEVFSNGHLEEGESANMGFPGIVVVGTLSSCFLNELMTQRFGDGYMAGGSLDMKFTRPTWMGSVVQAKGVIRKWEQDGPTRRKATCEVFTHMEDGTVTIVATATAFENLQSAKL